MLRTDAAHAEEPGPICPECRDGKHRICTTQALHIEADELVPCHCTCRMEA